MCAGSKNVFFICVCVCVFFFNVQKNFFLNQLNREKKKKEKKRKKKEKKENGTGNPTRV